MGADMELLKVGDLASRTGLSVRTLHHYEELGLLAPSQRTPSGHRLYGPAEVVRLQKIVALKQLGMSLEEIRGWLSSNRMGVLDALRSQRTRVQSQIETLRSVERRLAQIEKRIDSADAYSVDDVLEALEAMAMFEKYYTEAQLEQLEQRRIELGDETIKSVEKEWPELIAKVQSALQRGVDPHSAEARALGKRWKELVNMFTGGDAGIAASLKNVYANEPSVNERTGLNDGTFSFVQKTWQE